MLVECGYVRAEASDGRSWTFAPSLARIAALGTPAEIVEVFAGLDGPDAAHHAAHVLATLCEQDDVLDLIGPSDISADGLHVIRTPGLMPEGEQIVIARHLMRHGCIGKSKPGAAGREGGTYSATFDAAGYVAAARAHLGMSAADAEALSMTELQSLMDAKFPEQKGRDVPTLEEYEAGMAALLEKRRG